MGARREGERGSPYSSGKSIKTGRREMGGERKPSSSGSLLVVGVAGPRLRNNRLLKDF